MIDKNLITKIKQVEQQIRAVLPGIATEIDQIIETNSKDEQRIERILDSLLDYIYFNVGSEEFDRLNEYYSRINPENSKEYKRLYREAIN